MYVHINKNEVKKLFKKRYLFLFDFAVDCTVCSESFYFIQSFEEFITDLSFVFNKLP
jgi:hypothetical protein